jgi:tRNA (guanine37-N1)-methyltransferase
VFANDLNPESIKYLNENIKNNGIEAENIKVFNMDGREFIKESMKLLNDGNQGESKVFDHYIMNLPAIAVNFLDAFTSMEWDESPMIHCYLFSKEDDPLNMVKNALQVDELEAVVHNVRSVAPNKEMYCVSFKLPSRRKKIKLESS